MPSNKPSLASAIDLSTLKSRRAEPAPLPQPASPPAPDIPAPDEMPREFTISLIGHDGEVSVNLGFAHLRWPLSPDMADDLGTALLDAARQARATSSDGRPLMPTTTP